MDNLVRDCIDFSDTCRCNPNKAEWYWIQLIQVKDWITPNYSYTTTNLKLSNGAIYSDSYSQWKVLELMIRVIARDDDAMIAWVNHLLQFMSPKLNDYNGGYRDISFTTAPQIDYTMENTNWSPVYTSKKRESEAKVLDIESLWEGEKCIKDFRVKLAIWNKDCTNPGCFTNDIITDFAWDVNILDQSKLPSYFPDNNLWIEWRKRVEDMLRLWNRWLSVRWTDNCDQLDADEYQWMFDDAWEVIPWVNYDWPSCCPVLWNITNEWWDIEWPITLYTFSTDGNSSAFKIDIPVFPNNHRIYNDEQWNLYMTNFSTLPVNIYQYVDLKYSSTPRFCPGKMYWFTLDPVCPAKRYNNRFFFDMKNPDSASYRVQYQECRC